jgi:hypothetical protein
MTLTITIENATDATRLINDFCSATKWEASSGISKADWARDRIGDYIKQMAKRGEFKDAQVSIVSAIDAIAIT